LLSGLPPSPTYVHPDEQVELLKSGKKKEREREWVLPTQVRETWSLRQFAECFDGVEEEPPVSKFVGGKVQDATGKGDMMVKEKNEGKKRRGGKRMLLATVCDDSTVVYYIIHEGIVKPRQN
jgi:tRNA-splicing endonuclease subunit Sen15